MNGSASKTTPTGPSAASRRHLLLTALGVRPVATTYQLGSESATAEFAPVALLKLLPQPDRPTEVLVVCTDQARQKALPKFVAAVEPLGIKCAPLPVADGNDVGELRGIIDAIARAIPPGCDLTIDFTHGLRHMPFLFYAVAVYLTAFENVTLRGAWYGKLEGGAPGEPKPLLDIRALVELPRWFHAVQIFNSTGNAQALARQFSTIADNLPHGPERGPSQRLAEALKKFSASYLAALPLETGIGATALQRKLTEAPLHAVPGANVPLAEQLEQAITTAIEPYVFDESAKPNKCDIALTQAELQRQAGLVDAYLRFGLMPQALTVMREWVVSLGVLHHGAQASWLQRDTRLKVERMLSAMVKLNSQQDHGPLSDEQSGWARFWDQLTARRNHLAHAGMNADLVKVGNEAGSDAVLAYWNSIKSAGKAWPPLGGGNGTLLISPVGKQPGVLFSAIKATEPDAVLALCSAQSSDGARDAVRQAGFEGNFEIEVLEDPFAGYESIKGLVSAQQTHLLAADAVIVNLTGGTTLMGIAAQQMFESARNLQRPGRRLILIDRRPPDEQARVPWIAGEPFWLDKPLEENPDD